MNPYYTSPGGARNVKLKREELKREDLIKAIGKTDVTLWTSSCSFLAAVVLDVGERYAFYSDGHETHSVLIDHLRSVTWTESVSRRIAPAGVS